MSDSTRATPNQPQIGRRAALKAAAAAGAAAVVWSEPTIKGLARRPAYAVTASGMVLTFDIDITITVDALGQITATAVGPDGTYPISVQEDEGVFRLALEPGAQFDAIVSDPGGAIDASNLDFGSSPTVPLFPLDIDTTYSVTATVTC